MGLLQPLNYRENGDIIRGGNCFIFFLGSLIKRGQLLKGRICSSRRRYFQGRQLFHFLFRLPYKKGTTLKGKNLLLKEQILFLRAAPFRKGSVAKGSKRKQEVTNVVSLGKNNNKKIK